MPFTDVFIDIRHRFAPPGAGVHVLGTDQLGRDMLARLLMAGRISLAVGLSAMAISMGIGVCVGLMAGYYGGLLGAALMRLVDAMLCFPSIFLLLAVSAFITPSVPSIILLIASTSWMEVARIVEGQIRSLRERDYAVAAEALGASDYRVMFRELLPNAIAPIVVAATLNVAHAILAESYISFLGYGIQPPTPSWGNMLDSAQSYLASAPWLAILPGGMIALAVTSFNFLGDGLRDALDPRQDGR
jgi:peptide/nickel transport system permease protein